MVESTVDQTAEEPSGDAACRLREPSEREEHGAIPAPVHAPRGMLEVWADPTCSYHRAEFDPNRRIILHCGGWRPIRPRADTLQQMGYANVLTSTAASAPGRPPTNRLRMCNRRRLIATEPQGMVGNGCRTWCSTRPTCEGNTRWLVSTNLDLDADPIRQFGQWFVEAQAAEVPEPNAMVLATAIHGRRARCADRPAQGVRRARIPLLLELRKPERSRSRAEPARRVDVLLAPTGAAGPNLGSSRADQP